MYFKVNRRVLLSALLICECGFLLLHCVPTYADLASSECKIGRWAQGIKVGPGMDASGRILRDCVFVGLDLRNANFDGADMAGCEIYQCDLRDASFKNAIFTGLLWGDCEIEDADFTGAVINGIRPIGGVSGYDIAFTAAQFMSTRSYKTKKLSTCIVTIADGESVPHKFDFRDADLRGASLRCGDLRQSNFSNANITGIGITGGMILFKQIASTKNFKNGNLHDTGFGGLTILDQWNLSGIDLTNAKFNGSGLLAGVDLTDAIITNCFFRCSTAKEQLFTTQNYKEGNLSNIRFWNVDFNGADFSGINLTGCRFSQCKFTGALFDGAVISGVEFCAFDSRGNMTGLTLNQIKSTWNYKHGHMEGIKLPEEIAAALKLEQKMQKDRSRKGG